MLWTIQIRLNKSYIYIYVYDGHNYIVYTSIYETYLVCVSSVVDSSGTCV